MVKTIGPAPTARRQRRRILGQNLPEFKQPPPRPATKQPSRTLTRDLLPLLGIVIAGGLAVLLVDGIVGVRQPSVGVVVIIALVLVWGSYTHNWTWTGIGPDKRSARGSSRDVQRGKTLWDVLQLIGVPVVLALLGIWFNTQNTIQSNLLSQRQHQADAAAAQDQARETLLNTYIDRMSDLLLDPKQPLGKSHEGDASRTVARARTLETLSRLDGTRKGQLLRFLEEEHLITSTMTFGDVVTPAPIISPVGAVTPAPIISLEGADLSYVKLLGSDLSGADLSYVTPSGSQLSGIHSVTPVVIGTGLDLRGADLSYANLIGADLRRLDLSSANLRNADLRGATLDSASLTDATLGGANLRDVDLSNAELGNANLSGADLSGAILNNTDLSGADLEGADLSGRNLSTFYLSSAILRGANLRGTDLGETHLSFADLSMADLSMTNLRAADLRAANLTRADLSGADLSGADLSGADLGNAQVTETQLNSTKSLAGATMPDDTKHSGNFINPYTDNSGN